jgi:mono/diheme cytochrome c family protein
MPILRRFQLWTAMKVLSVPLGILAFSWVTTALAADPRNGRLFAQRHCAACHAITPHARNEVADAPSFDVIARKYHFNARSLMAAIETPHPKMNLPPSEEYVEDLAAYISSLSN